MGQLAVTQRVVQNVRELRRARKLSTRLLADLVQAAGVDLHRTVLANLENGRRDFVTVDELYALAEVLGSTPAYLAENTGPSCAQCLDQPPPGYTCRACRAEA